MAMAYFDCFAGAAGDMIVAALLDAGADFESLQTALSSLDLHGYTLRREPAQRGGLGGTQFCVDIDGHEHAHRGLNDILPMIAVAGLPPRATERATKIFRRLAEAEGKIHNISPDDVHFHEVGAIDSIVDIVGACVAMEQLGIDTVYCSAIPVGSGTIRCAHGTLPVPAPATAELLRGVPIATADISGEATTPTAAAILTALAESFGAMPPITTSAVGYGAGTRDSDAMPNLLRVFIGELAEIGTADTVMELSANIDDSTGELLAHAIEVLLTAGCMDAWATPAVMKKGRPGWILTALCPFGDADKTEQIILRETSTFGVRRRPCHRRKLARRFKTVETDYGPIRVKIGAMGNKDVTASPEFTDCRIAADAHHVPLKNVLTAARSAWENQSNT